MTIRKWIKSNGTAYDLTSMPTCHLFYTLRLVWNSMMPRPLSVGTYKSVLFKESLYTSDYWLNCLPTMFEELHSRTDLPARYKEQLATIQLDALLDRVGTPEDLAKAVRDFLAREDTEYVPEDMTVTWNNIQTAKDLTHSHHTLKQMNGYTKCPRCKTKFSGKLYFDRAGVTCPVCTSQYDYGD